MEIIEYKEEYLEDIKDLLVELEEYIISIDQDNLDTIHPEYREKKTILDLEELKDNGKCFIAIENNAVIGLIMGKIREYDKYDYLDYKCPKQGEITELIVSKKTRSKGGQQLMKKLEEYFKSLDCEYILVDIFAYNDNTLKFYHKQGFHPRMITSIKKI